MEKGKDVPGGGERTGVAPPPWWWWLWIPHEPAARGGPTTTFAPRIAGLRDEGSREPTSTEA